MKRIIATLVMLAGFAVAQDANQQYYLMLVNPSDTKAITGTGIDISNYKGNARLLVVCEANATETYTNTVTFQDSANNSAWRTITNTAGTAAVVRKIGGVTNSAPDGVSVDSRRLRKYIRAVVTQTGTQTNAVGALVVFPMKQ